MKERGKKSIMSKRGKLNKILAYVLTAIIMIGACMGLTKGKSGTVYAAYTTPRLMVTGCDIKGGNVKAGEEFILKMNQQAQSLQILSSSFLVKKIR